MIGIQNVICKKWTVLAGVLAVAFAAGAAPPLAQSESFAGRAKADASLPVPIPSPVDPFAAKRPKTEDVGVALPGPAEYLHPWTYTDYIARVTLFAGLPPMNGGAAFVGDSLTDYGRWSEAYPEMTVRNFGIVGDTTVGLENRLGQVVKAKPDRIFLMIGTNDIEYGRPLPEIAANVDRMLARLATELPKAKVYLESLLPRQPQFADAVKSVNEHLRRVAVARKVAFIDLYPHFAVEGGRMDPSVSLDDIHLAGAGYARWRELIQDYVYAGVAPKSPVRLPHRKRPTINRKGR